MHSKTLADTTTATGYLRAYQAQDRDAMAETALAMFGADFPRFAAFVSHLAQIAVTAAGDPDALADLLDRVDAHVPAILAAGVQSPGAR